MFLFESELFNNIYKKVISGEIPFLIFNKVVFKVIHELMYLCIQWCTYCYCSLEYQAVDYIEFLAHDSNQRRVGRAQVTNII